MDPITQGALGASVAQTLIRLEPERPHRIWMAAALGGMAADLDIVIRWPSNPMLSLLYHRHFTHSLVFIPIGALIVTLGLLLIPYFRHSWKITFLAVLIGYATHGVLDAATSYGTVLYWPFSLQRVHWDLIFIINPVFTSCLVLGTAVGIIYRTRIAVAIGLILAGLWLSLSGLQHYKALQYYKHQLAQQLPNARKIRVVPAGISLTAWRGIAVSGNRLFLTNITIPWTSPPHAAEWSSFPLFQKNHLPAFVRTSSDLLNDYAVFKWFTGGYLIEVSKNPLVLADGRYLIGRNPVRGLWGIQFDPKHQHVKILRFLIVRVQP